MQHEHPERTGPDVYERSGHGERWTGAAAGEAGKEALAAPVVRDAVTAAAAVSRG